MQWVFTDNVMQWYWVLSMSGPTYSAGGSQGAKNIICILYVYILTFSQTSGTGEVKVTN